MDTKTVTLRTKLEFPKEELDKWEALILSGDVDYEEYGFRKYECVWWKTVRFRDGFEIDLKICADTPEDRDLWTEAVLFNSSGAEYARTDVCDSLRGEWELEWTDKEGTRHVYVLEVAEKPEVFG